MHPTIRAHEQQIYEVTVPEGSATLVARAGKPSDTGTDLDLYVYDCTGKECRPSGNDARPSGDEMVTVQNPAAGKWKIVVDAASVPSGSTTYDYMDVVFNQSFGMVAVTDQPAKRAEQARWSAKTNVWTASLPDGRSPFAALLLEARPAGNERFPLGLLEVPGAIRVAGKNEQK
jgi:hypothetical protein